MYDTNVAVFVRTLLDAAVSSHILHLQTENYANHVALGALYEGLPGVVDALVEVYQGKYGIIKEYPPTGVLLPQDSALEFTTALSGYIDAARGAVPADAELQNQVDEIAVLVNSTLYKLRFLK